MKMKRDSYEIETVKFYGKPYFYRVWVSGDGFENFSLSTYCEDKNIPKDFKSKKIAKEYAEREVI